MTAHSLVIDFSNIVQKRQIVSQMGSLQGLWEVKLKKRTRVRTKQQHNYYHGAVVDAFLKALQAQGESVTHDDCHEAFKYLFLRVKRSVANPRGGEEVIIEYTRSTTDLDIAEFSIYLEKCIGFLAEFFQVVVVPSEIWLEETAKA